VTLKCFAVDAKVECITSFPLASTWSCRQPRLSEPSFHLPPFENILMHIAHHTKDITTYFVHITHMIMRSYQLFQVSLVFAALAWAVSAQPIAETDCAVPDNTNYDMKLAGRRLCGFPCLVTGVSSPVPACWGPAALCGTSDQHDQSPSVLVLPMQRRLTSC
jgi:hypothetical protein